jgi:hypothetical protein
VAFPRHGRSAWRAFRTTRFHSFGFSIDPHSETDPATREDNHVQEFTDHRRIGGLVVSQ